MTTMASPLWWLVEAVEQGRSAAYDFGGEVLSLVELDRRSGRLAGLLVDLGVGAQDRVAVMIDTGPDALVAWFAVTKAGGVCVPFNTGLRGELLAHQLRDCDPAVLVVEERLAERFVELGLTQPDVRVCVVRGAPVEVLAGTPTVALDEYNRLDPVAFDLPDPWTLSHLLYTSGTTGPAKGCMVSHNYVCNLARQSLVNSGRRLDEVLWTPLPTFHIAGLSYATQTLVLEATTAFAPRFSVSGFWPEIDRTGARVVAAVGSVMALVAAAPPSPSRQRCRGQIRVLISAPMTPEQAQQWRDEYGVERVGIGSYGMTEASLMATTDDRPPKPGTAGVASDSFEVRVVDEHDVDVDVGTDGEIVSRPRLPHVMFEGYWRNPTATAAKLRNLWFHTGDVGQLDAEGYLTIVDRQSDVLRRGGENIASGEIERVVLAHPDLLEVAVHAVPSALAEDEVKLTAVLRPGSTIEFEGLFAWLVVRLPRHAVPRYIELRDELPKNPTGRVLKFQLRQEAVTPSTWDRVAAGLTVPR